MVETQTAYAAPAPDRFAPPMPIGEGDRATADAEPGVDPIATNSTRPSGGWAVQVGSLGSEAEALSFLDRTAEQAGSVLDGARAFTEPFTRNGVDYVRARFGGFQSSQEAWDACNALKKLKLDCFAAEL